jgi:transposase
VNEELGFTEIVDSVVPKAEQAGVLTAGQYMLAFIMGRMELPVSKNGMQDWFDHSYLKYLWSFDHSLSCQNFLNQMSYLTDERMKAVTRGLCKRLARLGHQTTRVLFDPTNFSTELESRDEEDCTLARKGKAKDEKYGNNLVGLALAVQGDNLPIPMGIYPGNWNDHKVIESIIEDLYQRVEDLGAEPKNIALVVDKGSVSKNVLQKLENRMHLVGSLQRDQVPDLMRVPLSQYSYLYTNGKGKKVIGYGSTVSKFGKNLKVVIAFNEDSRRKQQLGYEHAKKRFLAEAERLEASLLTPHRGRKPSQESIRNRLSDSIPKKWRSVFKFHVGPTLDKKFDLRTWVVRKKEQEFYQSFGKTVVFTDDSSMPGVDLVKTYKSLWKVEEDFKFLKDRLLIPVTPIFHWKDLPIKVHIFLCVIGLLFYRYMLWKLRGEGGSLIQLVHALERIRIGVMVSKETRKVRHVVEEMDAGEARLFNRFRMDRWVQN